MGFRVLKGGLQTTVQDLGRTGYQSFGFSVSGVMDTRSFRIANILIDNPENEAALEFSLVGPTLEFTSDTIIALTGGDFSPKINGILIDSYKAIYIQKGDVLSLDSAKSGSRGYLAFSGKLDIPVVMGSRSTGMKYHLGGFKGRALQKGDFIGFRIKKNYLPHFLSRSIAPENFSHNALTLRMVLGPQHDYFTEKGLKDFFSSSYEITTDYDRMGCRLEGHPIEYKNSVDIISDGIAFGAIQVTNSGKPIVMMADRQTTGGYAKIGNIIRTDLPRLAQSKSGRVVQFVAVSIQVAQQLLRNEEKQMGKISRMILAPCKEVLELRPTAKRMKTLFNI